MFNRGFVLLFILVATTSQAAETILLNRNLSGDISGTASHPAISGDGTAIAFQSLASDLIAAGLDTNNERDIFVYDQTQNTTLLVSVTSSGEIANGSSAVPSISANGRYVAFSSNATNLVLSNTLGFFHVYVHDRQTGITTLASRNLSGTPANNASGNPTISANGRYIAFDSSATNIVANDINSRRDVFVFDRVNNDTARVSVSNLGLGGNEGSSQPTISADGRYIAFTSSASNFVDESNNGMFNIFRHDVTTGTTVAVSKVSTLQITPNGIAVIDTLGTNTSHFPSISDDGQFVAFVTRAVNLHGASVTAQHVVLKNMRFNAQLAALEIISRTPAQTPGNSESIEPSISGDGNYVYFVSRASDLVDNDTNGFWDTFLLNRQNGNMERISVGNDEVEGQDNNLVYLTYQAQRKISNDGRYVSFESILNGLLADDFNDSYDVFLRDRGEDCPSSLTGATHFLATNTWFLAALPCNPPSGLNTVGDIFGDDIVGGLGVTWAVFTFDSTLAAPDYVTATLSTPLKSGQGFWIQHFNAASITMDLPEGSRQATGRRTAPAAACLSETGCFELPLSAAPNTNFIWNLIGNPLLTSSPLAFDDLRVTAASGSCAATQGCTMAEAADSDIVFNRFFHYDGTGYVTRESGSALNAWEGYWVPELPSAEFNSPLIRFPR